MRSADTPEAFKMGYLSDMNLRAVLTVLVARAGGTVEITNEELYDAMMPGDSKSERFVVTQTATGVRVSIEAAPQERHGSN
jgi:hypothetical protein